MAPPPSQPLRRRASSLHLLGLAFTGTLLIQGVLWSSVLISVWLGDTGGFLAGFGILCAAAMLVSLLEQDGLAPALILAIFAALFIGPLSSNVMALSLGGHADLGPDGIRGEASARCLTVVDGTLHPELRGQASTRGGPKTRSYSATVAPLLGGAQRDKASARVWLVVEHGPFPEAMPAQVHRPRILLGPAEQALENAGVSGGEPLFVLPGSCEEARRPGLTVFKWVVGLYSLLWPVGMVLLAVHGLRSPRGS